MANLRASKRDIKKTKRNTERNKRFKTELKTVQKKARVSIEQKDDSVEVSIKQATSRIDSAASKGIIHKNTAARKKSRMMSFFNKSKASTK